MPVTIDPDDYLDHPIANACEHQWKDELMAWECLGGTVVYIFGGYDDGFEEFVEWLDDNAPGCLTTVGEDEYKEAAKDLGIPWDPSWPDWDDDQFEKVAEEAEMDLTTIGHTTLKNGTHIAGHEYAVRDVIDATEMANVKLAAQMECDGHGLQEGEFVYYSPGNEEDGVYGVVQVDGETIGLEHVASGEDALTVDRPDYEDLRDADDAEVRLYKAAWVAEGDEDERVHASSFQERDVYMPAPGEDIDWDRFEPGDPLPEGYAWSGHQIVRSAKPRGGYEFLGRRRRR